MSSIAENVYRVRERIANACARAGRDTESVRLIAVTKFVDTARIADAVEAGITETGENRAQDFSQKLTFFKQNGCTPHFIGQLQTNKIKYVCGEAALIHSVDRLPLAESLSDRAQKLGITQDILIQVNIGAESQKGGVDVSAALELLGRVEELPGLKCRGLMCVPPVSEGDAVRPYFAAMRELLGRARTAYPSMELTELSMGMTHDYEQAILEGATMVRVGTGIFGPRIV